ncbi:MAG TPA: GNAT family N-acetyltransferase [Clostridia bacterium]|nr:GNAT family N-acetyltransferase [Clostridia bacterium]
MILREYMSDDLKRVLELNKASVHFLSPLTKEKLESLIKACDFSYVIEIDGLVEAFILALSENKDYDSVNYQWFKDKYDKFLYIDRVVVSKNCQSQGLGQFMYKKIIKKAKAKEYPFLLAEIDVEPANPKSLKFHEKFGFKEVGRESIHNGKKVVSLQALKF